MIRTHGIKALYITLLLFSFNLTSIAQDGSFDVRMITTEVDCEKGVAYVEIEIKASANSSFHLGSQNYRFSFDTEVLSNPRIDKELIVSGLVDQDGAKSFYAPHSIHGSKHHLLSYNVVLNAGDGYLLDDKSWISVGRVSFDIIAKDQCMGTLWHSDGNSEFPRTVIIGKKNEKLFKVSEGNYMIEKNCLKEFCTKGKTDRA